MHILIHLTGQILHIMFGKPKTNKPGTKTGKMFIQWFLVFVHLSNTGDKIHSVSHQNF